MKTWDDSKPPLENKKSFGWVPGVAYRPEREEQLRAVLVGHRHCEHVVSAIKEVHTWLTKGGCLATGVDIPGDFELVQSWRVAYNLQPDVPLCERK